MRVLIVDDCAFVRERLVAALAESGAAAGVECAESVAAARRALGTGPVDAVVLDIRMPDGSGVDLLQGIKASMPQATVIMFTNHGSAHYRQRCLDLGADFFFDKCAGLEGVVDALAGRAALPAHPTYAV